MRDLSKLFKNEESSGDMDPMEKDAKKASLMKLKQGLSSKIGEGLKGGVKKVSVASDSPEGLEEGLELAQELAPEATGLEAEAGPSMDDARLEAMSEEELDEEILKLMMIKEKKKSEGGGLL